MTTGTNNAQIMYGAGPPVALAPNGVRYYDTTSGSAYAEYVSFNGAWIPVGTGGVLILPTTTVALLPAAAAGNKGWRAAVTDANATLTAGIGATVAGGGANVVPVFSDGTNWKIG